MIKKIRGMTAFWFVAIGAIVTILGAFFQEIEKRKEKEELLKKEEKRSREYEEIINNQITTLNSANQIIELQRDLNLANKKLLVANNKIQIMQDKTLNMVTGGDSKPILSVTVRNFMPFKGKKCYIVSFDIMNTSQNYPLKNVFCSINDLVGKAMGMYGKIKGTKSNYTFEVYNQENEAALKDHQDHKFNLGTVNIKDTIEIYSTLWTQPVQDHSWSPMELYTILIKSENSFFQYKFKLKEDGETCKVDSIELLENGAIIDPTSHFLFQFDDKPFKIVD